MTHHLHSRIICEATSRAQAMRIYKRIMRVLDVSAEITVCEPFGENPDQFYDIVCRAALPSPAPAGPMGYFESLLERIGGNWQEKQLAFYKGQKYQCSAVLDHYAAPRNGIAWMSLELHTAD